MRHITYLHAISAIGRMIGGYIYTTNYVMTYLITINYNACIYNNIIIMSSWATGPKHASYIYIIIIIIVQLYNVNVRPL